MSEDFWNGVATTLFVQFVIIMIAVYIKALRDFLNGR